MDTIAAIDRDEGLSFARQTEALTQALAGKDLRRILLLPPDITRAHSMVGPLVNWLYHFLMPRCRVEILPAVGSHHAMTPEQLTAMFGDVPQSAFLVHNWRKDLIRLGEVPAAVIAEISGGKLNEPFPVQVSYRLLENYDCILSLGQVVPHEVAGMANHAKNIFVGIGGAEMIHRTHWLGAVCGMESAMGEDHAPVRQVFDYASEHFLRDLPLLYLLTVVTQRGGRDCMDGLFIGDKRDTLDQAVALSKERNVFYLDKPAKKVVCYLEPEEFTSTWVGNKAIYRTRLAVADGGELLILAPGVNTFGEDGALDALIRKYGYRGTPYVMEAVRGNAELAENLSAAAHLIHGSSEGRFRITYAAGGLSRQEICDAGFDYMPYAQAAAQYPPQALRPGWQQHGGEEIYYIPNPALGLWKLKNFEE
ncbi:MAG: lactate racemase domain-containing protein [Eubacteriales bacterium]|nr:lactate racemase domain-containing protein [Eubacteriales bacterium]